MCGRFVSISEKKELEKEFFIDIFEAPVTHSFNIAPGQIVGIIIKVKNYRYVPFKWGLVPYWSKDTKIAYKLINCRAETITEKPSFKTAFKRRRCLIPAQGYYEWKKVDAFSERNKRNNEVNLKKKSSSKIKKVPYYIHLKSNALISFAGLWEEWTSSDASQLYTFTIITTEAPEFIKPIHERSPVIIKKEDRKKWLDTKEEDYKTLFPFLKPYKSDEMEMYEVSTEINNPKNDRQECIRKLI